jgi:hypothetical protein
VFEEVWLIVDALDTQAFASSATDQNGAELAALYTLQHRLTGNTKSPRCGLHDDISLGGVIDETATQSLGDANAPRCTGGRLLGGDEAIVDPAM